jgi:hypothetical protein
MGPQYSLIFGLALIVAGLRLRDFLIREKEPRATLISLIVVLIGVLFLGLSSLNLITGMLR